ncbi:MAG: RluA family pseudouridine synthase [Phototrophicaceae bacterium]
MEQPESEREVIEFEVINGGERLDKLVSEQVEWLSRSQVQSMIKDGLVIVEGRQVKPGVKLRMGDRVSVTLPIIVEPDLEPEAIDLKVVYDDEHIAVIDKPAGLVVHPGVGNMSGTLLNALVNRYPHLLDVERHGMVHRLDKDTSGLVVVAKSDTALANMLQQFQQRTVEKHYLALTEKAPSSAKGHINAPIGRDPRQRKKMTVIRDGKEAHTEFEIIEEGFRDGRTLLRVHLLTGRTHQIRVHLAFIGAPVVGDRVYGYGKQRLKLKRQFLHATYLSFDHPITRERMVFESPLPPGLKNILDKLREPS